MLSDEEMRRTANRIENAVEEARKQADRIDDLVWRLEKIFTDGYGSNALRLIDLLSNLSDKEKTNEN
jgi:hypothetical protein